MLRGEDKRRNQEKAVQSLEPVDPKSIEFPVSRSDVDIPFSPPPMFADGAPVILESEAPGKFPTNPQTRSSAPPAPSAPAIAHLTPVARAAPGPRLPSISRPSLKQEIASLLEERLAQAEAEWDAALERMSGELATEKERVADLTRQLKAATAEVEEANSKAAEASRKMAALAQMKETLDRILS